MSVTVSRPSPPIHLQTTHLIPSPDIRATPSPQSPDPIPGSSCYALREAVANLTFWGDYDAELIGEGISSKVYKVRFYSFLSFSCTDSKKYFKTLYTT